MKYFLGIDGGGTKTKFVLADYNLNIIESTTEKGCDYHHIGVEGVCAIFEKGIETILVKSNIQIENILSIAWGIPCFGETVSIDNKIIKFLENLFPYIKHQFFNDVELGLAGSLALKSGIHMVSGTGAIAIGKDHNSTILRCSGWDAHFGDEGSSYWLGLNTLRLFSMEADGRKIKGPLYKIIKDAYKIQSDFDIIDYFYKNLNEKRDKIAKIQLLLNEAALAGDISAIELYKKAAFELFITIETLIKKLDFGNTEIPISYSGGTFKAEKFILKPLETYLSKYSIRLIKPIFEPAIGAILLASKDFVDSKKYMNIKK